MTFEALRPPVTWISACKKKAISFVPLSAIPAADEAGIQAGLIKSWRRLHHPV